MPRVPLAVRLSAATGDKHITRRLRDLTFRKTINGVASIEMSFDQSLAITEPAVAMYGKVIISDGRHGGVIAEGRQEDPGRSAGSDGEIWSLQAFGPVVHADDDRITVCYVDNGTEAWQATTLGAATSNVGTTDDNPPLVRVALGNGTVAATNVSWLARSRLLNDVGQKLARWKAIWDTGFTDAGWTVMLRTRPGLAGTITTVASTTANTAGGTLTAVITTDIPAGDDVALFQLTRTGAAGTVVDEVHYLTGQLIVQGTRYNAAGTELTAGSDYSSDTLTADQVVADLLGRCLPLYDGATAVIATGTVPIDRLVYQDPTSPAKVLEDLAALEPDSFWRAGPANSSGLYSFEWTTWPSTVRYETSITADFDSPGNAGDLFNRVIVRYRDRNGRSRHVVRTLAQADLDAAGITRTWDEDLGDEVGSVAQAQQAGDQFLLDHNSPPNAGTITIDRPVRDLLRGRMVAPWEIEPGYLIRARGVLPRVDALNATARDAVSVFRLVAMTYQQSSNTAVCELDSLGRGTADEIYAAHKRIDRLRKR